jgi:hypothetical protein
MLTNRQTKFSGMLSRLREMVQKYNSLHTVRYTPQTPPGVGLNVNGEHYVLLPATADEYKLFLNKMRTIIKESHDPAIVSPTDNPFLNMDPSFIEETTVGVLMFSFIDKALECDYDYQYFMELTRKYIDIDSLEDYQADVKDNKMPSIRYMLCYITGCTEDMLTDADFMRPSWIRRCADKC